MTGETTFHEARELSLSPVGVTRLAGREHTLTKNFRLG